MRRNDQMGRSLDQNKRATSQSSSILAIIKLAISRKIVMRKRARNLGIWLIHKMLWLLRMVVRVWGCYLHQPQKRKGIGLWILGVHITCVI